MHLRALSTVRRITAARVFSPNPANRERFTKELADIGVPIAAVEQTRTVKWFRVSSSGMKGFSLRSCGYVLL